MGQTLTSEQKEALQAVVEGTLDAVRACGDHGAPGGVLYAALMGYGVSHSQYTSLMASLVGLGKLRREGDLYFIADEKPA